MAHTHFILGGPSNVNFSCLHAVFRDNDWTAAHVWERLSMQLSTRRGIWEIAVPMPSLFMPDNRRGYLPQSQHTSPHEAFAFTCPELMERRAKYPRREYSRCREDHIISGCTSATLTEPASVSPWPEVPSFLASSPIEHYHNSKFTLIPIFKQYSRW
ncbi:hypothetical protein E4T56_gene19483 [Termitomyces sp. T112]|nr:hypothetical protein E4T56_gene19483 [Termitomyces sp. T112]